MVSLSNRSQFSLSRLRMARLSSAKARVSRRVSGEGHAVWQGVAQALATGWKLLATFVLSLVGIFTFVFIAVLLWEALTQKTIAIAPISVPRVLAENGYTADVAAQRLHDALNKVVEDAHTSKNGPEVALQADLPSIVVPTIGLSIETIAADMHTFFHIKDRWNISGELIIAQKQLWLRLRMNGRDLFASLNGVDPERPDDLLAPAAEKVFELADPYIAAASLNKRDPGKSLKIARRIIASNRETDQSVAWAHNLVGNILGDQHKADEAVGEFRKAIELNPRFAIAHLNLGVTLRDQHKTGEAIDEFRKSIEFDSGNAAFHDDLGSALRDQHKTDEAIGEFRKSIELDSGSAAYHDHLGTALRDQNKVAEADVEYRKAIELDTGNAEYHEHLGADLRDQQNTEAAIDEEKKANQLVSESPAQSLDSGPSRYHHYYHYHHHHH
jgi:tetratricopeptide (TPR) repeat protein